MRFLDAKPEAIGKPPPHADLRFETAPPVLRRA